MISDNVKSIAYQLIEELRVTPRGRSAGRLAAQLRICDSNLERALSWLMALNAPVERVQSNKDRRRHSWRLVDREYRIPYAQLSAQCRLWELERAIAPGESTDLLDSVLRLQRDNRMLRERLMKEVA